MAQWTALVQPNLREQAKLVRGSVNFEVQDIDEKAQRMRADAAAVDARLPGGMPTIKWLKEHPDPRRLTRCFDVLGMGERNGLVVAPVDDEQRRVLVIKATALVPRAKDGEQPGTAPKIHHSSSFCGCIEPRC